MHGALCVVMVMGPLTVFGDAWTVGEREGRRVADVAEFCAGRKVN